jgi:hypothetical protein
MLGKLNLNFKSKPNMKYPDLNPIAQKAHESAKSKGFYEETPNVGQLFMLIISELSEALEADRKGRTYNHSLHGYPLTLTSVSDWDFKELVKDTVEDEIADAVIRILDFCGYYGQVINLSRYAHMGDFEVVEGENLGSVLLDVTSQICKSRAEFASPDDGEFEAHLHAALLLLFNLSSARGFDLMWHIRMKMEYNATRPTKHGKCY